MVKAEARLQLESDAIPVMACILGSQRKWRHRSIEAGSPQSADTDARGRNSSHLDHLSGKEHVGNVHGGVVH